MAKKITAPKTYDPGKGRPKEHLAYLNEREMAYLRSINGNNMERGPKGLPSFPPKDAIGSSSKASPSRGPGGPSGPNSSPSGSRGIGGGGKGSTTGGRGPGGPSGPNSAASGSRGVGGGSKGPGGPSGPNSGPSVSRGPSQAKTPSAGGYKGPKSPMSGQGSSFRAPSLRDDRAPSRDIGIQQKVQEAAAKATVKSNRSLSGDLTAGGIRALNVGPMGAPVKVGNARPLTAPNKSYYGPKGGASLSRDARMAAARSVGFNAPEVARTPGDAEAMGRMMMAESSVIRNKYGNPLTAGLQGVGDVIRNRMISERFPNTVQGVITQRNQFSPMNKSTMDKYGRTMYERTPVDPTATRIAESILSGESPTVVGTSLNYANEATVRNKPGYSSSATKASVAAMPKEYTFADYRRPGTYSHTFGTRDGVSDVSFSTPDGYGPSVGSVQAASSSPITSARTVSASMDPTKAISDAYKTVKDYYNSMPSLKDISQGYADVQKSIDAYRQAKTGPLSAVTGPIADAKIKEAVTDYAARGVNALKDAVNYGVGSAIVGTAYAGVPSGPLMPGQKAAVDTINKAEGEKILKVEDVPEATVRAEDVYGPKYVSPEVQKEMADIDKMNRRVTRGAKAVPGLGPVIRAADAIRGAVTGTNTAEADADLKRAYMQGNAAQRAELERRNPNLTKFAQQAGLEPQLPMSNYENWRQRSFGTGGASGVSTTVVGSGGTPDFGSGGKFQYRPGPGVAPYSPPPTTTEKAERGRPQQYYNWDAGVGIPSPGDSDYTLYLKYLEEKAAARAAV